MEPFYRWYLTNRCGFAFLVPYCIGGIAGPALQSIIGPLLMTYLFAWFTRPGAPIKFAGAPFLAGAVFMLISALIAARTMKRDTFVTRGEQPQDK